MRGYTHRCYDVARVESPKVRSPELKKPRPKRIRVVAQRLLLVLSFVTAIAAGSVVSWAVYDSLEPAPKVQSAAIDLRALALDPGAVYDRTPVTPSPSPVPTPSPTPAPTPVAAPPGPAFVRTPYIPPGREPYRLVIDSIGINAPVTAEYTDARGIPQVPRNGWEVAWYAFSAQPGTGDNAVFAGHVTWNGVAVFYNLNNLGVGDQIRLEGDDGTTLLYTVTDAFLISPDDPNAVSVMRPTGYDSITLISCEGSFYSDGAFGDYTDRRVIRASLIEKQVASG